MWHALDMTRWTTLWLGALCLPCALLVGTATAQDVLDTLGGEASRPPAVADENIPEEDPVVTSPAPPPAEARPPKPERVKKRESALKVKSSLTVFYTSNPFHHSNQNRRTFDEQDGPGQRFDHHSEPWDIVIRPKLSGSVKLPVGRAQALKLGLSSAYLWYSQNPIASYWDLGTSIAYELSKVDTVGLKFGYVPSRFRRNYKRDVSSDRIFTPGHYRQVEFAASYEREITDSWKAEVEYTFIALRYNRDAFEERERDAHLGEVSTEFRPIDWLVLGGAVGYGVYDSEEGLDRKAGFEIDRSFDQVSLTPSVGFRLPADVSIDLDFQWRRRIYTTNEALDISRHDRVDDRLRFRAEIAQEFVKGLEARIFFAWTENDSDRDDPDAQDDEVGYEDIRVGFGIAYRF
jgi:hypothetical protein